MVGHINDEPVVLGDLALTIGGVQIDIGAPKERQLLAALTINKNTIVSNDRLLRIGRLPQRSQ